MSSRQRGGVLKVFLISIVLLTSTSTSYSLSLSGIAGISEKLEDLHKNYSDNVEKVKKNMCPKKSWCRKWEGVICGISKRFFSICHTVCHAEEGFMKSKCVKQAQKNHNFDIEYGVYACGSRGGQVDTGRGSFQFAAQEAWLIENGEITSPLKDVSVSGLTLQILKDVDGLTKDSRLAAPGFCGKGQTVPVGDGGPIMRISEALVG